MRITENTKEIKINTLLKDSEGYFVVIDYDKQNDCYICIGCDEFVLAMLDKYGTTIFTDGSFEDDTFDDVMYCFRMEDLIEFEAEIVKEY